MRGYPFQRGVHRITGEPNTIIVHLKLHVFFLNQTDNSALLVLSGLLYLSPNGPLKCDNVNAKWWSVEAQLETIPNKGQIFGSACHNIKELVKEFTKKKGIGKGSGNDGKCEENSYRLVKMYTIHSIKRGAAKMSWHHVWWNWFNSNLIL